MRYITAAVLICLLAGCGGARPGATTPPATTETYTKTNPPVAMDVYTKPPQIDTYTRPPQTAVTPPPPPPPQKVVLPTRGETIKVGISVGDIEEIDKILPTLLAEWLGHELGYPIETKKYGYNFKSPEQDLELHKLDVMIGVVVLDTDYDPTNMITLGRFPLVTFNRSSAGYWSLEPIEDARAFHMNQASPFKRIPKPPANYVLMVGRQEHAFRSGVEKALNKLRASDDLKQIMFRYSGFYYSEFFDLGESKKATGN